MIEVEKLNWDSEFFKLNVGKLTINNRIDDSELISCLKQAEKTHFKVIYLFVDDSIDFETEKIKNKNIHLFDTKVVYQTDLNSMVIAGEFIPLKYSAHPAKLYNLAYQSGEFSRFKKDPGFGDEKFRTLYSTWVDKSVSGLEADYVSVIYSNLKPVGFATVKIKQDIGVIGLIAVNHDHRGEGIGKRLMNNIFHYLKSNGITKLEVATQAENKQACRFYENFGMTVKSKTKIYHLWYE